MGVRSERSTLLLETQLKAAVPSPGVPQEPGPEFEHAGGGSSTSKANEEHIASWSPTARWWRSTLN